MKQTDAKVNSAYDSSPESPQIKLFNQLNRLKDMLKDISYHLVESISAARAYAIVQTCISLEAINWSVMNEVTRLLIETDACNIFPTSKETRVETEQILQAKELAEEILTDMPFDFCVVNRGQREEVVIIGSINHLRRLMTRNMEMMAKIKVAGDVVDCVEIVAFPRTFAKFRTVLEDEESNKKRAFICDYTDDEYFLKEIRDIEDKPQTAFEEMVDKVFADFDEKAFLDFRDSQLMAGADYARLESDQSTCKLCDGYGRLPYSHYGGSYVCPDCGGKDVYAKQDKSQ